VSDLQHHAVEVVNMRTMAITAVLISATALSASAQLNSSEASRLTEAGKVLREIRNDVPQQYWEDAHCVAVIPDLKKAAFIFGGEYGKGAMSCRAGSGWSAPIFMQLAKGSWGFQAGAEQVDVVMLVMNESGVQKLLQNKVTLGADASVAAGPVGRQGLVATDAALRAEILSYSRAAGLFAGIDLSGGVLRPDADANDHAYGKSTTPRMILASRQLSAPTEAGPLMNALAEVPGPSAASTRKLAETAASSEPRPSAPVPTTDSDLRVRLVDIQQSLDRLLESSDRPVGTTGVGGADTITVNRVQLEQLRRQIDAALMALDKR
jgi:lipid-binding SYLF domain-containing protein